MKDRLYNISAITGEYALYGMLFFIPISISLIEIFAGLAFFSFVIRKSIKPDFKFIKSWPNILLLLFFIFNALSLLNSAQYLDKSIHALLGKWLQYLGICVIIQDSIYDLRVMKRAMSVFLCGASLTVLSGLSQYFFGVEFLRNKSVTFMSGGKHAMTSSFAHYNGFGGYLAVALSLAAALLLANNSFSVQSCGLFVFSIVSTVAIILTFSRGSWLGLGSALIFISIFAKKNFTRLMPIFLVIFFMFLFSTFHERLFFIFRSGGDNDRLRYWQAALKMINEHPFFGIGVGTFMANFPKYLSNSILSYAHNCYLQIWAETGVFSLVSFLIFISSIVCMGIKQFVVSRDFLLLGLLSGIFSFLVRSFFDTDLYSLQLAFLFWILSGLTVARLRIARDA